LPQSRRDRVLIIAFAILLAIFCVATGWLFVFPATGMPPERDAVAVPAILGTGIIGAVHSAGDDQSI
jgi:hypothetical protein